ncbi:MAG: hypothetical protein WA989_08740 [Henriciella sp.]
MTDMREAAPDWYEERKVELAGEGYPRLSDVPVNSTYRQQKRQLSLTRTEREQIRARFEADPRSEPADTTPEEIMAWSSRLRSRVDRQLTQADFLTDAELEALRARFDRPRARR